MDTMYILSQIFAVVAAGFLIPSYFVKRKTVVLILCIASYIAFAIQYFLLQAYVGAVNNIIAILPAVWFYITAQKGIKNKWWALIVVQIVILVPSILTWQNWGSILPIVASISYAYSVWQDNLTVYKWLGFFNTICWLIYAFILVAWVTIAIQIFVLISTIVSLIKHYVQNRNYITLTEN